VEFERVLNSVSKNDIKDFMAFHGVGSLGHQIEIGIKRTTADVAQGLLAGLLIVLLLFFGIVLLGLLASSPEPTDSFCRKKLSSFVVE
jgi:hypothetical protein